MIGRALGDEFGGRNLRFLGGDVGIGVQKEFE
jgi:hypothetical protein